MTWTGMTRRGNNEQGFRITEDGGNEPATKRGRDGPRALQAGV